MTELWHFSEDPTIEVFVPHRAPTAELDDELVWAIDSAHRWLYWFPRDCPRATWCAGAGDDRRGRRSLAATATARAASR